MYYELKRSGSPDYFYKSHCTNMSWPAHLHGSFEYITVLSGKIKITVENDVYYVSAGKSVLVFPNAVHTIESADSEIVVMIFSPELVNAYSGKICGYLPKSPIFTPSQYLSEATGLMDYSSSLVEQKATLYKICAEFDKTAEYIRRNDDNKNLLYRIFEYAEQNYKYDCSLSVLSNKLGFSYSYLSRYFKRTMGMSYTDYLNRLRIEKACRLLSGTDTTVTLVAANCGYDSIRSFNRNFIKHMGVSPKNYKAVDPTK